MWKKLIAGSKNTTVKRGWTAKEQFSTNHLKPFSLRLYNSENLESVLVFRPLPSAGGEKRPFRGQAPGCTNEIAGFKKKERIHEIDKCDGTEYAR